MEDIKTVLLVDDDPAIRKVLRRILNAAFEVVSAADAPTGLEIARSRDIDLIILDVCMPGMDGLTMAEIMRDDPLTRDIPVLMLTALAGFEDRINGLSSGVDEYLTKPFDLRELWDKASGLIVGGRSRPQGSFRN